jgi:hypothetical protein
MTGELANISKEEVVRITRKNLWLISIPTKFNEILDRYRCPELLVCGSMHLSKNYIVSALVMEILSRGKVAGALI